MREERRLAEDRDDDGVGDDAREDRRDEGVRFEAVAVEDLDGQERCAERSPEDRGDARRDAGDEQDPPLAGAHAERASHERAERAADLHRRSFASSGAPGSERAERRQRLDPDDAPPDDAVAMMEGLDRRIAAAAARLGGELREQAARQAAERRQQHQEPGPEIGLAGAEGERLTVRPQHGIAREILEQAVLEILHARRRRRRPTKPAATPTSVAWKSVRPTMPRSSGPESERALGSSSAPRRDHGRRSSRSRLTKGAARQCFRREIPRPRRIPALRQLRQSSSSSCAVARVVMRARPCSITCLA